MSLDKIKLTDDERAAIRRFPAREGHVARVEFEPHWTRRGPRPVTALRTGVFCTREKCMREGVDMAQRPWYVNHRYPATVAEVQILTCDALGNVTKSDLHVEA